MEEGMVLLSDVLFCDGTKSYPVSQSILAFTGMCAGFVAAIDCTQRLEVKTRRHDAALREAQINSTSAFAFIGNSAKHTINNGVSDSLASFAGAVAVVTLGEDPDISLQVSSSSYPPYNIPSSSYRVGSMPSFEFEFDSDDDNPSTFPMTTPPLQDTACREMLFALDQSSSHGISLSFAPPPLPLPLTDDKDNSSKAPKERYTNPPKQSSNFPPATPPPSSNPSKTDAAFLQL
mmetsp:Transcript_2004/g.4390  ORF Transcript_2004/g.4390 Transcript_2004/m.4390 type:complete len:233 (+) Transcript_2004:650-1348(+)